MPRTPVWLTCLVSALALAGESMADPSNDGGSGAAVALPAKISATDFGHALAAAARKQTSHLVFYNSAYRQIGYPMGDVPPYLGVCTDVVVRAYRALGIDLQVLVHKSGVGSGDRNIDHRRVEILRRFFARAGTSLPVTSNPADYQPGDIVTYYMPNGWLSKTHVAIVAAEKTLTGVPLVIHNRGWGVQAEDWLFAEKITGHFRFQPSAR
jgi:uncharacterized protein YijF (DUF1287 family)